MKEASTTGLNNLGGGQDNRMAKLLIVAISIIVPILVGILIFLPNRMPIDSNIVRGLPHLNGVLNTLTSVVLVTGFILIKRGDRVNHKRAMTSAFVLGSIFLLSYVTYHSAATSTVFGDLNGDGVLSDQESLAVGSLRGFYLIFLLTHIVFAAVVVPFVLFAFYYALSGNFRSHKKVVKWAYPIWLFVSISGVIVYLLISPYY